MLVSPGRIFGDAVSGLVIAATETEITAAGEEGEASVHRLGLDKGVGHDALLVRDRAQFGGLFKLAFALVFVGLGKNIGAKTVAQHIAGHVDVARIEVAAINMRDEAATQRRVDRGTDTVFVVDGVVARQPVDMDRLVGDAARNALVDHVDRAADRLAAVKQHGGATQNLDPLDGQRVDADRVIVRGVRCVERADPVAHHPDALSAEAANHRARSAGREAAARNPGQILENLAHLTVHVSLQFDPFDDRGAGKHVELAQAPARSDHDICLLAGAVVEVVADIITAAVRRIIGRLRLSGTGNGGQGNGEQRQAADGGELHKGERSCLCVTLYHPQLTFHSCERKTDIALRRPESFVRR